MLKLLHSCHSIDINTGEEVNVNTEKWIKNEHVAHVFCGFHLTIPFSNALSALYSFETVMIIVVTMFCPRVSDP